MYTIISTVKLCLTYTEPKIELKPEPYLIQLKGHKKFKGAQTNFPQLKIKGTETTFLNENGFNKYKYLEVLNSIPGCEVMCKILYLKKS